MWCQCFFKVRIASCLHTAWVARGPRHGRQLPSKALKIPTPNPSLCLLTPLLNIYIPIQTVSEGNRIIPLCFTLACGRRVRLFHQEERGGGVVQASKVINLTKPNSSVHRGQRSKQLLARPDWSLISAGSEWDVTPCFTNISSLSLSSVPQTTTCWTCQSLFCEQRQTDISPNAPRLS